LLCFCFSSFPLFLLLSFRIVMRKLSIVVFLAVRDGWIDGVSGRSRSRSWSMFMSTGVRVSFELSATTIC
jgi:hypothetical protein